jgi:hypothetical protein
MQWDPFEEYKHRNRLWFNMYKPDGIQMKILDKLAEKNVSYNNCGILTKEDLNGELFILTHPLVEEIINSKSIHIPLGYIHFQVFHNFRFTHITDKQSYAVFYVHSRCSFGKWPEFKDQIQIISETEHNKVNIGEVLNLFLEGMAKKYKIEQNLDHVILFNMSLRSAVESHKKNGWELFADEELSYLQENKDGRRANKIFENLGLLHKYDNKMYKTI